MYRCDKTIFLVAQCEEIAGFEKRLLNRPGARFKYKIAGLSTVLICHHQALRCRVIGGARLQTFSYKYRGWRLQQCNVFAAFVVPATTSPDKPLIGVYAERRL